MERVLAREKVTTAVVSQCLFCVILAALWCYRKRIITQSMLKNIIQKKKASLKFFGFVSRRKDSNVVPRGPVIGEGVPELGVGGKTTKKAFPMSLTAELP